MTKTILIIIGLLAAVLTAAGIMHIQSRAKKEPIKFCIAYPPLYFTTKTSVPPTWTYYIWMYEHNNYEPIKSGAILSLYATNVTSALVTGEALSDEFGAWKVKEVKDNYVIFEATKDAILRRSFEGFSVTAPKSMTQSEVNWTFFSPNLSPNKYFGKDTGWFTQGIASGPGK